MFAERATPTLATFCPLYVVLAKGTTPTLATLCPLYVVFAKGTSPAFATLWLLLIVFAKGTPPTFATLALLLIVWALLLHGSLHRVRCGWRLDFHGNGVHCEFSNCRLRSLGVPLPLTVRQCSCVRGFFAGRLAERALRVGVEIRSSGVELAFGGFESALPRRCVLRVGTPSVLTSALRSRVVS